MRGRGAVAGLLIATIASLAHAHADQGCEPVPAPSDPAAVTLALSHGWTSDPDDGREALYRPGCKEN